jgi:glycosyltransferase involved in cell wall biosynthesis
LEYSSYIKVIQITSAHIYLTYPFVLSWSLLEAMSCGALIIGSNTEPVTEVIDDNKNGLLVDFFDSKMIAKTITDVLNNRQKYEPIKKNARETIINKYDLNNICLPAHIDLIKKALK